ncbi:MAG: amylo-alpha-1,6-glucosidase [Phycisphaerales bacterium]
MPIDNPITPPRSILDASVGTDRLLASEWLLTNGTGGYAMGTALGTPTRRYHALLVGAVEPPVRREVLLHSLVERVTLQPDRAEPQSVDLACFKFREGGDRHGGVIHPRGDQQLIRFEKDAHCRWTYRLPHGGELVKTLRLHRDRAAATISYAITSPRALARIEIRPLVALRDSHSLLGAWAAHEFRAEPGRASVTISRGPRCLTLEASAGAFDLDANWWHGFEYDHERDRGYDCTESLFSPGAFILQSRPGETCSISIIAWMDDQRPDLAVDSTIDAARIQTVIDAATPASATPADRAALARLATASDDFIVQRGKTQRGSATPASPSSGRSIIAGYPWFSDWGRDSMISLPGLLLATGRYAEAKSVLATFAAHRRRGLIPNLFNDRTGEAEYNTADASLWFIRAACEYLRASRDRAGFDADLAPACIDVIDAYAKGTDHGIGMDPLDALIAAGDESSQLTWMDAKRDGIVFTPRHGKAVEINALWHHALVTLAAAIARSDPRRAESMRALAARARVSFQALFWNEAAQSCFDVLSPIASGRWRPDARIRPNQVFAVSLPDSPLRPEQQRGVLRSIKAKLLTPVGLRTLDPADPGYKPRYRGTMMERDAAYHNGTVWPWLLGPYAEAVLRVGRFSPESRAEAQAMLMPLVGQMQGPSLGQLPEVYDAEPPHAPGGCPAQAWSVAETLRVMKMAVEGS